VTSGDVDAVVGRRVGAYLDAMEHEPERGGLQYQRLYLPAGTSRRTAQTVLTLHAEYGEWELDRLRLYPDGSRRVILRRKARPGLPAFLPS
jgi:hypothetical protein